MNRSTLETLAAAVVAIVGMVLTSVGAFADLHRFLAPGSALVLAGGAWLGNALARRGVRIFPTTLPDASAGPEDR